MDVYFAGSAVRALHFEEGREHGLGEKKYVLYIQLGEGEDNEFTVSLCVCVCERESLCACVCVSLLLIL